MTRSTSSACPGQGWTRTNCTAGRATLRQFADEINTLSSLSNNAIQDLAHSNQSAFVATMAKHWDHHHSQVKAMREPLHVFAEALDVAGDAVLAQKGIVIAAATALAVAVGATQGEALVTFGLAEGEVPLEVEAAKKAINFALQELENKLLGYLINKAAADISSHLNGTISKLLMGGLGVANETYALKTDTNALRALAKTINTHARRTEATSSEAYRHSTNRKIETDGKGGRWHVAQVLEEALLAIAADIFRHLPGTLHQVMEDTEKDLTKAADTFDKEDAALAQQAQLRDPAARHPIGHRGNQEDTSIRSDDADDKDPHKGNREVNVVIPKDATAKNSPTIIQDRSYGGHALDRMQERGIMPSVVEDTVENGESVPGKRPGTTAHYNYTEGVTVITDTETGRVVTVAGGIIKQ